MEKVLVTGGAGFIGSHLCNLLIDKGYFVYCLDNLLTGKRENIKSLESNPNFEFLDMDLVKNEIEIDEINYIFHLASPASPADFKSLSEEIALVNSLGTLNLLKLGVSKKAKFLMASTSEVYGEPEEHPQKESYRGNVNSFGPRSCYDESKRFAETLVYIYRKKFNLDARLVRIFNTYGPRMRKDDGRVVSNFINQAISQKPLTIYGDGEQTRSFCYVSDMVDGIFKAMFSENTDGKIFNLGNPEEYKMIDLANKIKEMTKSNSEITYSDLPEDDPSRRCPNISKAKEILNWEPKVKVDEGLQKTIEYYKNI
ncbi:MAG: UDP-glucuronic acid decarboxylase family protein [Patescibacteria group bacterium]